MIKQAYWFYFLLRTLFAAKDDPSQTVDPRWKMTGSLSMLTSTADTWPSLRLSAQP